MENTEYVERYMTDHEFSAFLFGLDKHWTYRKIHDTTQFICNNEIVGICRYWNAPPCRSFKFIRKDLVSLIGGTRK